MKNMVLVKKKTVVTNPKLLEPFWRLLNTDKQTDRHAKYIYRYLGEVRFCSILMIGSSWWTMICGVVRKKHIRKMKMFARIFFINSSFRLQNIISMELLNPNRFYISAVDWHKFKQNKTGAYRQFRWVSNWLF